MSDLVSPATLLPADTYQRSGRPFQICNRSGGLWAVTCVWLWVGGLAPHCKRVNRIFRIKPPARVSYPSHALDATKLPPHRNLRGYRDLWIAERGLGGKRSFYLNSRGAGWVKCFKP